MFEEYLQDASDFLFIANEASKKGNPREARKYYRASVFYLAGATEAFLNFIADSFAKANKLPAHEIAFLNDKSLIFSPEKGTVIEKIEFHRLEDKLRVLINRFESDFDFQSKAWNWLMQFKK